MLRKFNADGEDTHWGLLFFLAAVIIPPAGVALHCSINIWHGKALAPYDLIIMDHPVLTNLGVTYLEVLIGDVITLFAIFFGLYFRHRYYRDERDFMRKHNIKQRTGFTRDFTASGENRGSHYDTDCDD